MGAICAYMLSYSYSYLGAGAGAGGSFAFADIKCFEQKKTCEHSEQETNKKRQDKKSCGEAQNYYEQAGWVGAVSEARLPGYRAINLAIAL